MTLNCEQVKQLFHLYDETAQRLNDIKNDLNKSIFHGREKEESEYHYAVFRNMKNFIVSEINKIVTESNYQGFKEEDFMVPSEKLEEEKKFKQWERLAFEPKASPNPNFTIINKEGTISIKKRSKEEWEKLINCDLGEISGLSENSELDKKHEPFPFPHYKSPDWNNYMVAYEKKRKADQNAEHEKAISARYEKLKHALDDSFGLIPPEEREESMNEKEVVKEPEHETQSA